MLSVKNKKHGERIITHLCGAMERKNIIAEIDYRFWKYTASNHKNNNFKGTKTNTYSSSSNLLMSKRDCMLQNSKKPKEYIMQ
jgi:hypothetical protein